MITQLAIQLTVATMACLAIALHLFGFIAFSSTRARLKSTIADAHDIDKLKLYADLQTLHALQQQAMLGVMWSTTAGAWTAGLVGAAVAGCGVVALFVLDAGLRSDDWTVTRKPLLAYLAHRLLISRETR